MTDPPSLTDRQLDVARLIGEGYRVKQIAAALGLQERRVYAVITSIAFVVSTDRGKDDRVMIARWWWDSHPRADSA